MQRNDSATNIHLIFCIGVPLVVFIVLHAALGLTHGWLSLFTLCSCVASMIIMVPVTEHLAEKVSGAKTRTFKRTEIKAVDAGCVALVFLFVFLFGIVPICNSL